MKNIALKLSVVLFAVVFAVATSFGVDTKEVAIKTNMHCGACQSKIENTLKTTNGVASTNVDLAENIVKISYNPSETNEETLTKTISDLGYNASVAKACSTKDAKACSTSDAKACSTDKAEKASGKECGSDKKCCTSKAEAK